MAQHNPCNTDRAMPRPRLKPDSQARHAPFHYRAVPGPRVGRPEHGRAWAGLAQHGPLARYRRFHR
jgi:hypothetical protein